MPLLAIGPAPLALEAIVATVSRPEPSRGADGAVSVFLGLVRNKNLGRTVRYLEYEAYGEMAESMLARLAQELKGKHGLCEVAIHHRTGRVEIGEPSVVIAVSAPHRRIGGALRRFVRSHRPAVTGHLRFSVRRRA